MLKKFIYALCLFSGVLFMNSCDEVAKGDQTLDFLNDSGSRASTVSFSEAAGEQSFNMVSNTSWSISVPSDADWLTVYPLEGSNDARITIKVAENTVPGERSAVVTLKVDGKAGGLKVNVTQLGPLEPLPAGVIFDAQFNKDGTAEDVSGQNHEVITFPGSEMVTYYNQNLGAYVAHFNHTPATTSSSGFYKIPCETDSDLWKALVAGHSMEILVRYDANFADYTGEVKPFSAMEAGGVGFLIGASNKGQELTFLPNISANGKSNWIWGKSGVQPAYGTFYHLVGVYDKASESVKVYLNGELKNTVSAPGSLNPAKTGARWFSIGGDAAPSGTTSQASWRGDIAIARIFDAPLTQDDVDKLYSRVKRYSLPVNSINIKDIVVLSDMDVAVGSDYAVIGTGFEDGDKLLFESQTSDYSAEAECLVSDNKIAAKIPAGFATGTYKVILKRGSEIFPLGTADLTVTENPSGLKAPKIIAHRGYHKNAPENSVAAFAAAQELGVYGSETDVWITTDGKLVVNHDAKIGNLTIQDCTYDQLKDLKLSNGESLPTLDDMLDQLQKSDATKLIIEIKTHSSVERQTAAATAVVTAVKSRGLDAKVEYIAFNYDTCKGLAAADKNAVVGYLNGDKSPAQAYADGIKCLDYQLGVFNSNPSWVREAHEKGMVINMWTLNSDADMIKAVTRGADYVTTDNPDRLQELSKQYFK